jgi:L-ribulokinase
MGRVTRAAYTPDTTTADAYDALYAEYCALHDHFGRGGTEVMKRLKAIRREALGEPASGEPAIGESAENTGVLA